MVQISPTAHLHAATVGAVGAIQALYDQGQDFRHILDIGCGDGILTMIAGNLWPNARLTASDISENAVRDASGALGERAMVLRADGFQHEQIAARAPYDLIICNLVAEQHLRMAADLKKHLAEGGFAIISGLLAWLKPAVMEAYEELGLFPAYEFDLGEWQVIILQRPPNFPSPLAGEDGLP